MKSPIRTILVSAVLDASGVREVRDLVSVD